MSIDTWIYLWAFYLVPLIYISVFVPVPYCLDDCGFVVETEVRQVDKGNYKQGEKTAIKMGENNSKQSNRQRINLKNIQTTPTAQFQKNKRPNQKVGQRSKQTFL